MIHKWLLIAGKIVRPKPGNVFKITEVPKENIDSK